MEMSEAADDAPAAEPGTGGAGVQLGLSGGLVRRTPPKQGRSVDQNARVNPSITVLRVYSWLTTLELTSV